MRRWIALIFLVTALSFPSQAQDPQEIQNSCREFVQSFYDWYAKRPDWPRALKERPSAFSSELLRRLQEDHAAQVKAPGDIAGLDFDPILASQDPLARYTVGRISVKAKGLCWAEIHRGSSNEKNKDSYVAAELLNNVGRWYFVNFYYASANSDFSASLSDGGLLKLLRELRKARQKAAKTPSIPESTTKPQNKDDGSFSEMEPSGSRRHNAPRSSAILLESDTKLR